MRFYIKTLGCKVNHVESAYIHEKLKERGFFPSENEKEAELFIINSWAVTERAYKEVKKILRGIAKLKPKAVFVVGCASKVYAEDLRALATFLKIPNFWILGQNEKFELESFIENLKNLPEIYEQVSSELTTCYPLLLKEFYGHSRAFVNIQDGCSSFCSYCIVPYTRGPSRSLHEEHILRQIELYISQGYEEIVLTGIHLGMWGEDLKPKKRFLSFFLRLKST